MNQATKIVELLTKKGKKGATNIDLNRIAFRYGARLHELRKEGYVIKTQHIKGSIWVFRLEKQI